MITGVAGFIGSHAANRFMERGASVVGVDNLSRRGTSENLEWLRSRSSAFQFVWADIRQANDVRSVFARHRDVDVILHLAAQVAVTTSVADPRLDFEVNALGTLNVLEATREYCPHAALLFASTNKVYGGMESVGVVESRGRYTYRDQPQGISEDFPLDLYSPYGCSKGAADQYVHDYARIYGLKTIVFRQSCIYGTRQLGVEDQGWLAWFAIATALGRPLTIYGDGKQVRDVLWVDDLVNLYFKALTKIEVANGQVYNAGGGPENTLSLWELISLLESEMGLKINPRMADWRPGDQRVFISDISKAKRELGWVPEVSPMVGVRQLVAWTMASRDFLGTIFD
ncbi:MAG: CDP-paratose 2-epimerase [Anaerolinea sp.]|nr:CDP-paratose 2-epimerase [Anaerolinea sp.]